MFCWRGESRALRAVVIALYCLISIIEFLPVSGSNATFAFARLWIELLLWEVFLFCLWPRREDRKRADPLRMVSLCAVVVVVWSLGALGYHRHFAHLNQEMSRRIPAPRTALSCERAPANSRGFCLHSNAAGRLSRA